MDKKPSRIRIENDLALLHQPQRSGRLTSAEVKLEIANVLNFPCLYMSSIALRVSWKGVPRSAACIIRQGPQVEVVIDQPRTQERSTIIQTYVKVKDIDAVRLQGLQGLLQLALQDLGLVSAQLVGVPLGSDLQASIFVPSLSGPVFLFPADVDSGSVYFIVATKLKGLSVGGPKRSKRCQAVEMGNSPAFLESIQASLE